MLFPFLVDFLLYRQDWLTKKFSDYGEIPAVIMPAVIMPPFSSSGLNRRNTRHAFVNFMSKNNAMLAIAGMNNFTLEGGFKLHVVEAQKNANIYTEG